MKKSKCFRLLLLLGLLFCSVSAPTFANADELEGQTVVEEPLFDQSAPPSPATRSGGMGYARNQITDATQSPYQSVCQIQVNNRLHATGVVIGKNAILTNRHVAAAAKNGNPKNIQVHVGRTTRNVTREAFYGSEIRYFPDNPYLAIVYLRPNCEGKNISDEGAPAHFVHEPKTDNGVKLRVLGYPGDKPFGTMWESAGECVGEAKQEYIFYKASMYPGNSGSPIFDDKNDLMGLHVGSIGSIKVGIRLQKNVKDFVMANVEGVAKPQPPKPPKPPVPEITQKLDIGGQAVSGFKDGSHKDGFARLTVRIEGHDVSLHKWSDYQFHWSHWQNTRYASVRITDPKGKVLHDQSWTARQPVVGNGYKTYGEYAKYHLPEEGTIEIYHAEGPWQRYATNDNSTLKSKKGYTYTYRMKDRRLVLDSVK